MHGFVVKKFRKSCLLTAEQPRGLVDILFNPRVCCSWLKCQYAVRVAANKGPSLITPSKTKQAGLPEAAYCRLHPSISAPWCMRPTPLKPSRGKRDFKWTSMKNGSRRPVGLLALSNGKEMIAARGPQCLSSLRPLVFFLRRWNNEQYLEPTGAITNATERLEAKGWLELECWCSRPASGDSKRCRCPLVGRSHGSHQRRSIKSINAAEGGERAI